MPRTRAPRKGTMQFWPRKRAKREYARVRSWPHIKEPKLLGFAGYKVGMSHVIFADNRKTSTTKNLDISCPITIIECPPLKAASVRFYKNSPHGFYVASEVFHDKLDKELSRRILIPKTVKNKIEDITDFDDLRLLVYTQPKLTSIGKKIPEIFELGISGTKDEKLTIAKSFLGKEIPVDQVLKAGQQIDIRGVSKGKGLQGPVRRFGISKKQHKSEKGTRRLGTLGGWKSQGHFMYRVAHAGQMGYHQRMELNKWILKIDSNSANINPNGGFAHYGLVKNPYLIVKGSIIGPPKRLIRFSLSPKPNSKVPIEAPVINYIHLKK